METTPYGFSVTLGLPYREAVQRATLKEKLDAAFRPYVILGACNPALAYRALQANLDVGLLLPCNVVVYEAGAGSVVAVVDPSAMLGVIPDPTLRPVAEEARERLQRVARSLATP